MDCVHQWDVAGFVAGKNYDVIFHDRWTAKQ